MYQKGAAVGGLVAGIIGALVWAAIVYVTEYEVGWIAWGIGAFVGMGVAAGNQGEGRAATGFLALLIAALSIIAGRYMVVQLLVPGSDEFAENYIASLQREEFVVSFVAGGVASEWEADGKSVQWPETVDPAFIGERHWPPDIWREATARWTSLTPSQRREFKANLEADFLENAPSFRAEAVNGAFFFSFGLSDVFFIGLAMLTAFSLGISGGREAVSIEGDVIFMEEETGGERGFQYPRADLTINEAILLAILQMAYTKNGGAESDVDMVRETYGRATGIYLTEDQVLKASQDFEMTGDQLATLKRLASELDYEQKAKVLGAAVAAGATTGALEGREISCLRELALSLELSPEEFRAILQESLI